jgi:hypothetical protein
LKQAGVITRRLILAIAAYIALAALVWTTMDAGAVSTRLGRIPFRLLTLAALALLALRTVMHAIREHQMAGKEEVE